MPPLALTFLFLGPLLLLTSFHITCHAIDATPPLPDVSIPKQGASADSGDASSHAQAAAAGDVSTCSADGASTCSADAAPAPLHMPLLWMGPFLSGGGYASEAISYASALVASGQVENFAIRQHGDGYNWDFISGLPDATQVMLQELLGSSEASGVGRTGVVVCHSEPGAWNPPLFETSLCPPHGYTREGREGGTYTVGRTMFETDRLLPEHVKRCNKMDEVGLSPVRSCQAV